MSSGAERMKRPPRSGCPIANGLEIFGDKWTLVLVRDLLLGKSRYSDFLDSPEGITTNILADRLAMMERQGLIEKSRYQDNPPRHAYALTTKGEALLPVLQAMCRWANAHVPETWTPPASFMKRRPS